MNQLEVSLEILKILISKEEFDALNFEVKTEKIIKAFLEIYEQVLAIKNIETISPEEIVDSVEGADRLPKFSGNKPSSADIMINASDGTNTGRLGRIQ
ncbi:hypothetical protein QT990_09310 [Microcoleus sp. T3_B1]|uniref:hypothetical protein n=1 Tax=Microcoleus sp. T3_B1 TaxID=3055425 RepID=UPI002FD5E77E